jgi:hypothetical protein
MIFLVLILTISIAAIFILLFGASASLRGTVIGQAHHFLVEEFPGLFLYI